MTVITEHAIKQLAGLRSQGSPIVSCYLDVDGRRQVRPQDYRRTLATMIKQAGSRHGGETLAVDLARITEHVAGDIDRHAVRGLAMFVCGELDLWHVIELAVPVHDRIVVNQSPALGPLEAVLQELEPLGILLVDRQRARLFVFHFGEIVERSELVEELPRDYDRRDDASRGSREREQHHVEELAMQHLRHSAEAAFTLHRDRGFGRFAIGATDEVFAAITPMLHPYLSERLGPRLHLGVGAKEAEVVAAALAVEHSVELQREQSLVDRLRVGLATNGRAVSGLAPVLGALGERRVDTLLVSNGFIESGWICGCGALALRGPRCPIDGAEMERTDDLVSDAIDAAFGEGARVVMCEANADLDVHGRIGALLRY